MSITENGAVGYKTTSHALADFNYKVASYRHNINQARADFRAVLAENEAYALKYMFYVRDAREGIGERDLFRALISELLVSNVANKDEIVGVIIKETPEFGRYDDLMGLIDTKYADAVVEMIKAQLKSDFANYKAGKSISLLAKWMPSANASSRETRRLANKVIKALGTTPKEYRQTLSALRAYSKVIETMTCAKEWYKIDYNAVPSKANIKYANAFLRNDETRRREFLGKLAAGDKSVKINSAVNFPHDVVAKYVSGCWGSEVKAYDETLEQLWKNLKEVEGLKDTIVVRDGSGSMNSTIGGSNVRALTVATALGVYCAEHNSPAYRNKIITFSARPQYIDFSDPRHFGSLYSKLKEIYRYDECSNTNVEAVFDLILKTAVDNNLAAEDLPKQVLILSDMEFDSCAYCGKFSGWGTGTRVTPSLFSTIAARYAQFGYKLPKLVFWNLNSRTGTIPMTTNEAGVILVSGFSQNILSLVNNGKTDPYDALIDELSKERYESIPLVTFGNTASGYSGTSSARKSSTRKTKETPSFLK